MIRCLGSWHPTPRLVTHEFFAYIVLKITNVLFLYLKLSYYAFECATNAGGVYNYTSVKKLETMF